MGSSATLVTSPPEETFIGRVFGELRPQFRPIPEGAISTVMVAISEGLTPAIRIIELADQAWESLGDNETGISSERQVALIAAFPTARIRLPRIPARYTNAADELRRLLPGIGLDTLAEMCGVSDTGYRNWFKGKGIRERSNRRLLEVRALVKALVLQRGTESALTWLQKTHPDLTTAPIDAICAGRLNDVTALAIRRQAAPRQEILPAVESGSDELIDAHTTAMEQEPVALEVYEIL